jgi:UDP-N-acetylmuramoyl-L-alanyl-D-glutamate--2,6-diaminopimelate ligase
LAAAVGFVYGLDLTTIVRGLEAVPRIPGRLDRLECGQPFGVFFDAANTPAALESALATLRRLTEGRLICVAAAGRDEAGQSQIGKVLERYSDAAFVQLRTSQRQTAIRWALSQARPGDCVLIAGAAKTEFPFRPDGRPRCDDREFARRHLQPAPQREFSPLGA